jgi:hypothetical protein
VFYLSYPYFFISFSNFPPINCALLLTFCFSLHYSFVSFCQSYRSFFSSCRWTSLLSVRSYHHMYCYFPWGKVQKYLSLHSLHKSNFRRSKSRCPTFAFLHRRKQLHNTAASYLKYYKNIAKKIIIHTVCCGLQEKLVHVVGFKKFNS